MSLTIRNAGQLLRPPEDGLPYLREPSTLTLEPGAVSVRDGVIAAFEDDAGADVVIDAAGTDTSWRQAPGLVRKGGTVVFFGGLPAGTDVPVDAYRLHYEELTLLGAFHHTPRTVRAALAFLASGAYPWERLITHRVRLEDVPSLFADPPRDLLKAAVVP